MELHTMYPTWIMVTLLALIPLCCLPGIQQVPTQVPPQQLKPVTQIPGPTQLPQVPSAPAIILADMIKATVQIYGLETQDGELTPSYSGSGTIISSTGLILTNAHIASPASQGHPYQEPEALAIGLMDQEDQPPVFLYLARVLAVDGYLDLAVIQVTSTIDGADVDPTSLDLPFVPLGNSDDLLLGDHLNIFGFPSIDENIITSTSDEIVGFASEEGLGDRTWIKIQGYIPVGNSGGLAANDAGFIIGIPTIVALGPAECRGFILDTNGDGVVGGNDTCILIGAWDITNLRPLNLALPLIEAARSGHAYVSPHGGILSPSPGSESFGAITWYTGTGSSGCQPKDQVDAFPSGTTAIAAAWSFDGMTEGEPWAVEWKHNGEIIYKSRYSWFAVNQGQTSLCFYDTTGMPDGNYHIDLYAGSGNKLLAQSDVVVGAGANP
jgi:S1-C subfamily serine protease